jgi:hypothetical protein
MHAPQLAGAQPNMQGLLPPPKSLHTCGGLLPCLYASNQPGAYSVLFISAIMTIMVFQPRLSQ